MNFAHKASLEGLTLRCHAAGKTFTCDRTQDVIDNVWKGMREVVCYRNASASKITKRKRNFTP